MLYGNRKELNKKLKRMFGNEERYAQRRRRPPQSCATSSAKLSNRLRTDAEKETSADR